MQKLFIYKLNYKNLKKIYVKILKIEVVMFFKMNKLKRKKNSQNKKQNKRNKSLKRFKKNLKVYKILLKSKN